MRLFISALVLLATTYQVIAQAADTCTYTITGQVIDDHDGEALEFATVQLLGTGVGAVSDIDGSFVIENICPGEYTLYFSHIGCEPLERRVNVNKNLELTLRLEHHAEILEEIELTANRVVTAGSVTQEELSQEALTRTQGQALGEAMRSLPGVTAIQTGPAIFKPVIHGFHSNRVLILNDGVRQESQQWGLDHAPEIDPFMANSVTVVKGTAAVQYGSDAVAGVILVQQDTIPVSTHLHGRVAWHGMTNGWQSGVSGMLQKGLGGGFGVRWHGTVKIGGDKRAPDYQLTNTGVREGNTSLSFGYRRGLTRAEVSYSLFSTEIGILRSAHIGNLTDLEEALERGQPQVIEPFSYEINNPKQRVQHHMLRFAGQRYFNEVGLLSGFYAIQLNRRREYDIRRGGRDEKPALDLRLTAHHGELRLAHDEILGLRGNIAAHWIYRQNSNVPGTGVRPLIPNYSNYSPGISIVEKWLRSNFELEAGLRYEYEYMKVKRFDRQDVLRESEFNFNNFSSSLGFRWDVSRTFALTGNLGSTNRAPEVNELFSEGLHHGAAAIEEGDTSLVPEKAIKLIIGGEIRRERIQGQVSVYTQFIRDFIYLRPDGEPRLTIRGAFPVFRYVQNDARLWGTDVAFRFGLTRSIDLESKYSMVRATNTEEDQPLIFMPADRMSHALIWTSRTGRFDAGVTFDYVWEQTRVPEGLDYAPPPDAYALFGISAGSELFIGANLLSIRVTVSNLLNTRYREYLNRLRYFADDIGRNVELRINYNF